VQRVYDLPALGRIDTGQVGQAKRQHAAQAAHGEGAAAEAEQEDLVAFRIVARQPVIGTADVAADAHAQTATQHLVDHTAVATDTRVVILQLFGTVGSSRGQGVVQLVDIGGRGNAALFLFGRIPGA